MLEFNELGWGLELNLGVKPLTFILSVTSIRFTPISRHGESFLQLNLCFNGCLGKTLALYCYSVLLLGLTIDQEEWLNLSLPDINSINMYMCGFLVWKTKKAACFWKRISPCFFVQKLWWNWFHQGGWKPTSLLSVFSVWMSICVVPSGVKNRHPYGCEGGWFPFTLKSTLGSNGKYLVTFDTAYFS
jgi:hypothetical protein